MVFDFWGGTCFAGGLRFCLAGLFCTLELCLGGFDGPWPFFFEAEDECEDELFAFFDDDDGPSSDSSRKSWSRLFHQAIRLFH